MYVFLLFDNYCQARIILIIAFFECIAISWVYGKHHHSNLCIKITVPFIVNDVCFKNHCPTDAYTYYAFMLDKLPLGSIAYTMVPLGNGQSGLIREVASLEGYIKYIYI